VIDVDSNILAILYLPGEYAARTDALLERATQWATSPQPAT